MEPFLGTPEGTRGADFGGTGGLLEGTIGGDYLERRHCVRLNVSPLNVCQVVLPDAVYLSQIYESWMKFHAGKGKQPVFE